MAITRKTRKALWGQSGNRCAICRQELVMEGDAEDQQSIIGEECHIVARSPDGPRGDHPLPFEQRDDLSNLLLLCRNDHKQVDDDPDQFTVELLQTVKAVHKAWVRENLAGTGDSKSKLFYVHRVDSGAQLCRLAMGCHAYNFSNEQPENEYEVELIGALSQNIQDGGDLWGIMEAQDRISMQFEFDRQLKDLRDAGFLVYATERQEVYTSDEMEKPLRFDVAYVFVYRTSNTLTQRKDDEVEQLMQQQGQTDSEFTNFIPVVRESSRVRFV